MMNAVEICNGDSPLSYSSVLQGSACSNGSRHSSWKEIGLSPISRQSSYGESIWGSPKLVDIDSPIKPYCLADIMEDLGYVLNELVLVDFRNLCEETLDATNESIAERFLEVSNIPEKHRVNFKIFVMKRSNNACLVDSKLKCLGECEGLDSIHAANRFLEKLYFMRSPTLHTIKTMAAEFLENDEKKDRSDSFSLTSHMRKEQITFLQKRIDELTQINRKLRRSHVLKTSEQ